MTAPSPALTLKLVPSLHGDKYAVIQIGDDESYTTGDLLAEDARQIVAFWLAHHPAAAPAQPQGAGEDAELCKRLRDPAYALTHKYRQDDCERCKAADCIEALVRERDAAKKKMSDWLVDGMDEIQRQLVADQERRLAQFDALHRAADKSREKSA